MFCAVLWWPFWKWQPVEICQCRDIIIYPRIKLWWYRTMLNFCDTFWKYRTNSTLSDFNAISNVGRLWCPELIPDFEEFLPVAIFKMAATILHKFRQCWICAVLSWPFWKWRLVEIYQCRDIIIYPRIKFWWYRTILNFCEIVVAILKIATAVKIQHCSMSFKFWFYRHFICG
jgi:hypothetical protein